MQEITLHEAAERAHQTKLFAAFLRYTRTKLQMLIYPRWRAYWRVFREVSLVS